MVVAECRNLFDVQCNWRIFVSLERLLFFSIRRLYFLNFLGVFFGAPYRSNGAKINLYAALKRVQITLKRTKKS